MSEMESVCNKVGISGIGYVRFRKFRLLVCTVCIRFKRPDKAIDGTFFFRKKSHKSYECVARGRCMPPGFFVFAALASADIAEVHTQRCTTSGMDTRFGIPETRAHQMHWICVRCINACIHAQNTRCSVALPRNRYRNSGFLI